MEHKQLYVNPSCFKLISGKNLSHANKSLVTCILYFQKRGFKAGKPFKIGTSIPVNLLINLLASNSLRNFDFDPRENRVKPDFSEQHCKNYYTKKICQKKIDRENIALLHRCKY